MRHFGRFRFDDETSMLFSGDDPVPLGRRAASILKVLLENRSRVVTKHRLLDSAWPGLDVEESNLSVQVAKLRQAIGGHWIRTIERVGYQFVPERLADGRDANSPSSGDAFPVIALLEFDIGEDSALARVGHALRADLVVALARFRAMHVIADQLDDRPASYRLELSLARNGGGDAQAVSTLTESVSGRIFWAQRFEIGDPLVAAEAMAAGIESAVQAAEFSRGPLSAATPGAEAYAHYLAGRRVLNSSLATDNAAAFDRFMMAVRLAPENATYLAAASEAMHHRLSVGWQPLGADDKRVGRELAYRTLALAGDDAVAIGLVGNTLFTVDEEDLGLALCRRALEINPNSQLVLACAMHAERWGGSLEASARIAQRATGLAPNDPAQRFAAGGLASAAFTAGDYESALAWARRSLSFGAGYSGAHWNAIAALVALGRKDDAERHMLRYLAIAPGATIYSVQAGQHHVDRQRFAPMLKNLRQAGMPER